AGVRTRLYLSASDLTADAELDLLQAVGVAGVSRSLPTEQIAAEISPTLHVLAQWCEAVHYKTCSTFDSSPTTGSIGRVIEIGRQLLSTRQVPVVVGAPALSRYCVFGNLFARSGAGSPVYRLDRHPTMSRHPITPMDEADLALHLQRQTKSTIGNVSVLDLDASADGNDLNIPTDVDVVLLDTLTREHLATVGRYLWQSARPSGQRFWVGSSGVEYALTEYWHRSNCVPTAAVTSQVIPVKPLLVVSGSCSPVTAGQIDAAITAGFIDVPISPQDWLESVENAQWIKTVVQHLREGHNVIVHAACGPADPRIAQVESQLTSAGRLAERNQLLGSLLAGVVQRALDERCLTRIAVAGGDTSGYVAKLLGIVSLDFVAPLAPGSPLCLARGTNAPFELTFKGGQVGGSDFFLRVLGAI
ncbi:MAG: four-carbon acid sugar kinase family protein, partial [Planctomycetales bacterium]|nr:four-carbon acid sugar kinase family protein [Planctomycetales bacterium]